MTIKRKWAVFMTAILTCLMGIPALADDGPSSDSELANKLANPIASLISVPIQINYDTGYGAADGEKVFANVQPVIPFELNADMTLVTRTIIPVAWQNDTAGNSGKQFGLGDTLQSFFLVPTTSNTSLGALTWGVGPAVSWPTSTDRLLGTGTLALGPTGVALLQKNGWTVGALVNHQWGVARTRDDTPDVNNTFVQPFISFATPDAWTYSLNTESSYNWTAKDFSIPINFTIAKLTTFGEQKVQFQWGLRYWADPAENGPDGIGARFAVTFLFPE